MIDLTKLFATPPRSMMTAAMTGLLAVAVPAAALLSPAAPAAAQTSNKLDEVVAALRAITTLRADFVQTDRSGQALRGVVTLKNPGKIRFEYAKGTNMLVVSNGRSLTFNDYSVRQQQRWPISNSPLGVLLDPKRDVKRYGRLLPTTSPDVLSIEVKDPKKPEYGTITLIFVRKAGAPGGLELNSWVALDAQNIRTTVRLDNHRYGITVADSAFNAPDPRQTTRRPR